MKTNKIDQDINRFIIQKLCTLSNADNKAVNSYSIQQEERKNEYFWYFFDYRFDESAKEKINCIFLSHLPLPNLPDRIIKKQELIDLVDSDSDYFKKHDISNVIGLKTSYVHSEPQIVINYEFHQVSLRLLALQEFSTKTLAKSRSFINQNNSFKALDELVSYQTMQLFKDYLNTSIVQDILKPENLKKVLSQLSKNSLTKYNLEDTLKFLFADLYVKPQDREELVKILIEKSTSHFSKSLNREVFLNTLLTKYSADIKPYEKLFKDLGYNSDNTPKDLLVSSPSTLTALEVDIPQWIQRYPSTADSRQLSEGYTHIIDKISSALNTSIKTRFDKSILTVSKIQNMSGKKRIIIEVDKPENIDKSHALLKKLYEGIFANYIVLVNASIDKEKYQKDIISHCWALDSNEENVSTNKKEKTLNKIVALNIDKIELEYILQPSLNLDPNILLEAGRKKNKQKI